MKQVLLLSSILFCSALGAQNSSIVVFSEEGKQFTLILNGLKMNNEPETNVKITNLTGNQFRSKVIFADGTPDIDKNIYTTKGVLVT